MLLAADTKEFKDSFPFFLSSVANPAILVLSCPAFTVIPGIQSESELFNEKERLKVLIGTENSRFVEQAEAAGHHTNQVTLLNFILFYFILVPKYILLCIQYFCHFLKSTRYNLNLNLVENLSHHFEERWSHNCYKCYENRLIAFFQRHY